MKPITEDLDQLLARMRERRNELLLGYQLGREYKFLGEVTEILDQIAKRLAAGSEPVKVLIAVYDHTVEVMASTASAKVVSVDHRSQAGQRLQVGMAPVLAVPAEFIEAVSDEAAEYLSCKADQLSVLSKL